MLRQKCSYRYDIETCKTLKRKKKKKKKKKNGTKVCNLRKTNKS